MDNKCESCIYYVKHYYFLNKTKLRPTNFGHCLKYKSHKCVKNCKHYEYCDDNKEKYYSDIYNLCMTTREKLNNIITVLFDNTDE